MSKFKYFEMAVTNQNFFREEIKSRLSWRNACYYCLQSLLPSYLHSKNLMTYMYKTIIFPTVLRVFENRVLRRIFGPKREELAGGG
jgi:hypothetical protein